MQTTEKLHPEAIGLDEKSDLEILTILYESQIEAAKCVSESMASLEAGAKAMADAVLMGNKLVLWGRSKVLIGNTSLTRFT